MAEYACSPLVYVAFVLADLKAVLRCNYCCQVKRRMTILLIFDHPCRICVAFCYDLLRFALAAFACYRHLLQPCRQQAYSRNTTGNLRISGSFHALKLKLAVKLSRFRDKLAAAAAAI